MAFQTGTASDPGDLIQTLFTFATANGWTQDHAPGSPAVASMHKNNVYVHFDYGGGAFPPPVGTFGIFQSESFGSPADDPENHPGSSFGSGVRPQTNRLTGPYQAYWFFENDANPAYIHCVVETTADEFVHFGFGEIDKVGAWTGGEYSYNHFLNAGGHNDITNGNHAPPFYSYLSGTVDTHSSFLAEGLPGQTLSPRQKWLTARRSNTGSITDGDGVAKKSIEWGGAYGGPYASLLEVGQSTLNNYTPVFRIPAFYRDPDTTPDIMILLGYAPDVLRVTMTSLSPRETFDLGGDTYYTFPIVKKNDGVADEPSSLYHGLAYKEVTA